MLIETHAHLDYPEFAADFDDVLQRANQAGVKRIITIGTSVESSRHAVNLAEKYPSVFAAIGVHPTYAEQAGEDVITPLRELAKSSRVVAIGETGLDFHHLPSVEAAKKKNVQVFNALQSGTEEQLEASIEDGAYKSRQADLFRQQLDLAVELRLNVIIHQRDAWDDTLEILRDYGRQISVVFHCFGGTFEQANEVCRDALGKFSRGGELFAKTGHESGKSLLEGPILLHCLFRADVAAGREHVPLLPHLVDGSDATEALDRLWGGLSFEPPIGQRDVLHVLLRQLFLLA